MPLGDWTSKFEKTGCAGSRFVIRWRSSRARSLRFASSSASVVRQSVGGGNAGPGDMRRVRRPQAIRTCSPVALRDLLAVKVFDQDEAGASQVVGESYRVESRLKWFTYGRNGLP